MLPPTFITFLVLIAINFSPVAPSQALYKNQVNHRLAQDGTTKKLIEYIRGKKLTIKLMVVVDSLLLEKTYQKNEDLARLGAEDIINRVNAAFKSLDINIHAVHIEIWNRDPIAKGASLRVHMDLFQRYAALNYEKKYGYDTIHLMTGHEYPKTSVVFPYGDFPYGDYSIQEICESGTCAVIQSFFETKPVAIPVRANTMVHLISHNLGALDDTIGCICNSNSTRPRCVMGRDELHLGFTSDWSDCTLMKFKETIDRKEVSCPKTGVFKPVRKMRIALIVFGVILLLGVLSALVVLVFVVRRKQQSADAAEAIGAAEPNEAS